MSTLRIAIDPGKTGAIVFAYKNKTQAINMPDTMKDIWDIIHSRIFIDSVAGVSDGIECIIEKVGTYMPGNSGPSAATFAEHVGALKMALIGLGIRHHFVTPAKWMKEFVGDIKYPKSFDLPVLPKDKKSKEYKAIQKERSKINAKRKIYRKNEIKARAQQLYPDVTVTLNNADALGMLNYLDYCILNTGGQDEF